MITHIQGRLVEKNPTNIVIDCGGVGYEIHISLHTFSSLPQSENVKLFTHLLIKEDSHTLFRGWSKHGKNHAFFHTPQCDKRGHCSR